jgi:hypothetical protein
MFGKHFRFTKEQSAWTRLLVLLSWCRQVTLSVDSEPSPHDDGMVDVFVELQGSRHPE